MEGEATRTNIQSTEFTVWESRFIHGHKLPSRNPVGKEGQQTSLDSIRVPDYDTASTTSAMPLSPPNVGVFMEKVKCQTEKATVLGQRSRLLTGFLLYDPDLRGRRSALGQWLLDPTNIQGTSLAAWQLRDHSGHQQHLLLLGDHLISLLLLSQTQRWTRNNLETPLPFPSQES